MFRSAVWTGCIIVTLVAVSAAAEPVNVLACDFTDCSKALAGYNVSVIETGEQFVTDGDGMLRLNYSVGQELTFVLAQTHDYHETQTGTVIVPLGGLVTTETQVVLQVPTNFIYGLFKILTNGHKDDSMCQVVVTVCNKNRTINSFPQGLPGVTVTLDPPMSTYTYYFGVWGRFSNDTDPLPNNLKNTSWDGGVLLENVPPAAEMYVVNASLPGFVFSTSLIRCLTPGQFINAAPNQGPRVISGPTVTYDGDQSINAGRFVPSSVHSAKNQKT